MLFFRGIGLLASILSAGCADRPLDDEIAQVCIDSCQQVQLCDLPSSTANEQECIDECVPRLIKQRGLCEAKFELMHCLSTLTCDEHSDYAELVDNANYPRIYETEYPCKPEVVADVEQCSGPFNF